MAKQKEPPRGADFRSEWERLDRDARRRVRRAANRALPARNRREAGLAASMASNQRRMWRWVWIVAPVLVAVLRINDGIEVVLANFLAGLVIFGLMAAFFFKRAQKAERINLEIYRGRKPSSESKGSGGKGSGSKGPGGQDSETRQGGEVQAGKEGRKGQGRKRAGGKASGGGKGAGKKGRKR